MRNNSVSFLPVFGIAQLMFLFAKVFGFVTWSWWTILLPTFIPLGIIVVLVVVMLIISGIVAWASAVDEGKRSKR